MYIYVYKLMKYILTISTRSLIIRTKLVGEMINLQHNLGVSLGYQYLMT